MPGAPAPVPPMPAPPASVRSKTPWNPWLAVGYAVLLFLLAQFLAGLLLIFYGALAKGGTQQQLSHWVTHAVTAQFWYVLLAEALTFTGIWWFLRQRRASLRTIGWGRFDPMAILYALGGFAVYFIGYTAVLAIVSALIPALNTSQKQDLGFNNITGGTNLLLTFVSLVVLPPIVEEMVFRGFILTSLLGRMKTIFAVLITSALFATAHLEFGSGQPLLWVAAIDTFVLSLVLCYLRLKTNNLWASVFLHALKNGLAFVVVYVLAVR